MNQLWALAAGLAVTLTSADYLFTETFVRLDCTGVRRSTEARYCEYSVVAVRGGGKRWLLDSWVPRSSSTQPYG
jgi:hypothetical protein